MTVTQAMESIGRKLDLPKTSFYMKAYMANGLWFVEVKTHNLDDPRLWGASGQTFEDAFERLLGGFEPAITF